MTSDIFNRTLPKLEETDILCDKCDGYGIDKYFKAKNQFVHCDKCHGTGKLDWIENIVGKNKKKNELKPGVYIKEVDLSERVPAFNDPNNSTIIDWMKFDK